jgi:hypothetical protein
MRLLAFTRFSRQQKEILIEQVQRIWARQGIEVRWACESDAECLSVVLVDQRGSPAADTQSRVCALGEIPFVAGRPLRTLYVALNRVRDFVRDSSHFNTPGAVQELLVARVAGRAAAHELAHYLLATPNHASRGLLRAVFSAKALLGPWLDPFMLEDSQQRALSLAGQEGQQR